MTQNMERFRAESLSVDLKLLSEKTHTKSTELLHSDSQTTDRWRKRGRRKAKADARAGRLQRCCGDAGVEVSQRSLEMEEFGKFWRGEKWEEGAASWYTKTDTLTTVFMQTPFPGRLFFSPL